MPGAKKRALSLPVELHAVGPGHSRQELRATKNHFGISSNLISKNLISKNLRKITHHGKNARSG
jgi:hypothetical protein